jgi:uncharacterized protein YkwD
MKKLLLASLLFMSFAAFGADSNEITPENVLRVMNEYRAQEMLPPLDLEKRLNMAAGDRMRHMEEEGFWSHTSPEGLSPFTWVKVRAYQFSKVGENLATGFETARVLVESWMESPGHRANIMSPDFEDVGISIIDGSTQGPATGKSIVVMFGRLQDTAQIARSH